jgi:hypothetical protein
LKSKRIECDEYILHKFRRTYFARLLQSGYGLRTVQARQHSLVNRMASQLSGFGIMSFDLPATAKNSALPKCGPSRCNWVNHHLIALDTRYVTLPACPRPSRRALRVVTGIVEDIHYYGRTPVIFASRSPHMEDIGALRPLCANKSERLELKNWPLHIALKLAQRAAERTQVWAGNSEGSWLGSLHCCLNRFS